MARGVEAYRRRLAALIDERGEDVTIKRQSARDAFGNPTGVPTEDVVKALVKNYDVELISGGAVEAHDRQVTVLADDLTSDPDPTDVLVLDGRDLSIVRADPERISGVNIAWVIQARGAGA